MHAAVEYYAMRDDYVGAADISEGFTARPIRIPSWGGVLLLAVLLAGSALLVW
jgi:hypothetical protein